MPRFGESTGEYRGLIYRDDAALNAWLAKRPAKAALEPDLPIIDPHHHFWDTPQRGHYLLPELADIGGGHIGAFHVRDVAGGRHAYRHAAADGGEPGSL